MAAEEFRANLLNTALIDPRDALAARQVIHRLVPREALRALMLRSDRPAARRLLGHVATLLGAGVLVWLATDSWLRWPAMLFLGIVSTHLFAAQHECSHFTAFRSRRANAVVAWVCGAIIMVPPLHFQYEHTDHHRFTNLPQQDPQHIPMPATLLGYLWYLSGVPYWWGNGLGLLRRACGKLTPGELGFIPAGERSAVRRESRVLVALYTAAIALIAAGWHAPLDYWIWPLLLGQPVMRFIRMTEHVGCPTELDMLRNTRSTEVSAFWRFLAWNMSFHTEHHLVPAVPFHALAELNRLLDGRVLLRRGYRGAHREILGRLFARVESAK